MAATATTRFVATVGDGVATFDGQAGINTYDLSQTSAAATVNLATGTATSAQTAAATLVSIQNVVSGLGNDTITGDANNNTFFATVGDGNDSYTGGARHRHLRSVGDRGRRDRQPRARHGNERRYRHRHAGRDRERGRQHGQ